MNPIFNEPILQLGERALTLGNVLGAIIVVLVALVLLRIARAATDRRARTNPGQGSRLHSAYLLIKYAVWLAAIVTGFQVLGVNVTFLIAGSAALLVGLGLGLQQTFNDFVSGIIILLEGTIRVGDVLEVEGLVGRVTEIKLRTSTIYTRDGMNVIVPNHRFINENVVNWSHNALETRFHLAVGVAYGSDENKVRDVLVACAEAHPMVISDDDVHAIIVRLTKFGDSSLDFELLFWSRRIFRIEQVQSDLRFAILKGFREADIKIPFPQRDVHLISPTTDA